MTIWDYLDKHWFVGPALLCFLAVLVFILFDVLDTLKQIQRHDEGLIQLHAECHGLIEYCRKVISADAMRRPITVPVTPRAIREAMNHILCPECFAKDPCEEKCCAHGCSVGIACIDCGRVRAVQDPAWTCGGTVRVVRLRGMSIQDIEAHCRERAERWLRLIGARDTPGSNYQDLVSSLTALFHQTRKDAHWEAAEVASAHSCTHVAREVRALSMPLREQAARTSDSEPPPEKGPAGR